MADDDGAMTVMPLAIRTQIRTGEGESGVAIALAHVNGKVTAYLVAPDTVEQYGPKWVNAEAVMASGAV